MKRKMWLFFALYIFWIVLSERITVESLVLGVVIASFVASFNNDSEAKRTSIRKPFLFVKLVLLLLKEIVLSNIDVAKVVLSKDMNIQPQLIEYETSIKSEKLRVIFANAITITPGTITVSLEGNKILVHMLKEDNISGITESKIEKLLLEIEGN